MDWIELAQERWQWYAVVKAVMNYPILWKLLISCAAGRL
jgi:hypothetical protein